jgi:sec-independent protein translocase protein TatA
MLNGWEILLIVAAFFLLFGAKKLPALAKALGQSIKQFKEGFQEKGTETYGKVRKGTERYGNLRKGTEAVPSGSENA